MANVANKRAVYRDLLTLPADVKAEIIAGEIVATPSPLPQHSKAQGGLRRFIGGPYDDDDGFGGPGGWWIFIEVDVQLSAHDVVRPDLAGWRRDRLPHPANVRPIEVVPDWICEVLSPSTGAHDRVTKSTLYAARAVTHYWIVDVESRTLEAFEHDDGRWKLVGSYDASSVARVPPFLDVELAVGRLFLPDGVPTSG